MLKTHERTFSLLQRVADGVVVGLSLAAAYYIRFNLMHDGEKGLGLFFLKLSPGLIALTLYFCAKLGLYRSYRFNSRSNEILSLFKANTLATLTFILFLYFIAPARVSRITLVLYFAISQVALITLRLCVRNFLRVLRKRGYNLRHVLLVGNGPQMGNYIETVKLFKDSGIRFLGWIEANLDLARKFEIPVLNDSMEEARQKFNPDTIVLGYAGKDSDKVEALLKKSYNDVVPLQVLPDLSFSFIGHEIEDFAGVPLLTMNQPKLNTIDLILKRAFDFSLSFVGLILISPLLILLALLVKLSSPGPFFFGQKRMGLDGKTFTMWKFRTMKMAAPGEDAKEWSNPNNPRKTRVGSLLRKTSLDELPQIWNVVVGDMSLVGPRPEQPFFVEKFKHEIPLYMLRHKMKAGITGWAQVNGWRGDTSLNKRIECDIYYIKNWSLWLDIKILFLTFWKGLLSKNAY
ncbi:MAG: undecaprenyl-phosphate glucose phosphotransferase [Bdellovibrionales bacterium GWA2_49_15]|nr:MAG: undecaprenyl-phosphate glucose phosphotransferase [Bdellovibrionales bacterium GWA2_49_15]HAZ11684.1 undecaprenyl-phosphate glucose phosphotransferase [Bdellovibrionales bacterium]